MAKRISSPSVGLCLDLGHAHIVAGLRRTDPLELIEPALDRAVLFHLHDNLGARRGGRAHPTRARSAAAGPPPAARTRQRPLEPARAAARPQERRAVVLEVHPPRPAAAHLFEAAIELWPRRRSCRALAQL